jgi:hypothetical protein
VKRLTAAAGFRGKRDATGICFLGFLAAFDPAVLRSGCDGSVMHALERSLLMFTFMVSNGKTLLGMALLGIVLLGVAQMTGVVTTTPVQAAAPQ